MQTYSHALITALISKHLKKREQKLAEKQKTNHLPPTKHTWLMLGSIAPDVLLILLTLGFIFYDLLVTNTLGPNGQSSVGYLFDTLFFESWWVNLIHNVFHAPILVVLYMMIGYWLFKQGKIWGAKLFWFATACLLHTLIDTSLHYDDGPLILFPFNWQMRFYSPISYWDPEHYGIEFALFEHILDIFLIVVLLFPWLKNRFQKS